VQLSAGARCGRRRAGGDPCAPGTRPRDRPGDAGRPVRRGDLAGIVAVLVTAVLWGTTGTAATFAPSVGPLAMGAAALGIGGVLQALIALPQLRRERAALASQRSVAIAGALGVVRSEERRVGYEWRRLG